MFYYKVKVVYNSIVLLILNIVIDIIYLFFIFCVINIKIMFYLNFICKVYFIVKLFSMLLIVIELIICIFF